MAEKSKFSALYYPYSRCLREVDLKRMILIFDEILFVDPLSKDLGLWPGQYPVHNQNMHIRIFQESGRVYFGDRHLPVRQRGITEDFDLWNWFDVREIYSYLQEKGVIRLLDPKQTIRKNDTLIGYSVVADMVYSIAHISGIASLFPPFSGIDDPKWILHRERIPDTFAEIGSDDRFWKSLAASQEQLLEKSRWRYSADVYRNMIRQTVRAKEMSNDERVLAPYEIAYLLILNQALLLCEEYSAYPITDDGWVHRSLLHKCAYSHSGNQTDIIHRRTAVDSYQTLVFTLNVIGRMLPDTVLHSLSFQQIINYRTKNRKLLTRFWDKMVELSSKFEHTPYDSEYPEELKRFIEVEVVPEVKELDIALSDSFKQLFGTSVSKLISEAAKTVAPSISTMSLAALLGLTPEQIVILGVSGLLSGIGIVLPDIVSGISTRKKLSQNGLAYLMNIPHDRRFQS